MPMTFFLSHASYLCGDFMVVPLMLVFQPVIVYILTMFTSEESSLLSWSCGSPPSFKDPPVAFFYLKKKNLWDLLLCMFATCMPDVPNTQQSVRLLELWMVVRPPHECWVSSLGPLEELQVLQTWAMAIVLKRYCYSAELCSQCWRTCLPSMPETETYSSVCKL